MEWNENTEEIFHTLQILLACQTKAKREVNAQMFFKKHHDRRLKYSLGYREENFLYN